MIQFLTHCSMIAAHLHASRYPMYAVTNMTTPARQSKSAATAMATMATVKITPTMVTLYLPLPLLLSMSTVTAAMLSIVKGMAAMSKTAVWHRHRLSASGRDPTAT